MSSKRSAEPSFAVTQEGDDALFPLPVYASRWIAPDCLIIAGGGGEQKTGIPNALVCLACCW